MMPARMMAAIFALIVAAAPAVAQVTDFLSVPGPIELGGKAYALAWSSRPSANYIKQEYVPSGQKVETYSQMVILERLTGDIKVIDAVRSQVDMLKRRKASDPLVNMDILQHDATGEVVLDFVLSAKDAKGEYIVEWNAYRYAPYRGPSGKTGILLFAVSHRAYGDENARAFLVGLKQLRPTQIGTIMKAALPAPAI